MISLSTASDYLPAPIRSAFEQAVRAKRFGDADSLLRLTASLPKEKLTQLLAAEAITISQDEWELVNRCLVHCFQGGGPWLDAEEENTLANILARLGKDAQAAIKNGVAPCL